MWGAIAVTALQQLPSILQFAEQVVPGSGKGTEKKLAATSELVKYEGALALDPRVKDAKAALIDAQVAYLNAIQAATEEAQRLGIVVAPFAQPAPATTAAPPPAQPTGTTAAPVGSDLAALTQPGG